MMAVCRRLLAQYYSEETSSAGLGVRRSLISWLVCLAILLGAGSPRCQSTEQANGFGRGVIRRVLIRRHNVFGAEEKRRGIFGDDDWLDLFPLGADIRWLAGPDKLDIAQWANRIHFKTQESVIKNELPFHVGDKVDLSLLKETERNLRSLGIFRDAEVTASELGPGSAQIDVVTWDAWTLDPEFSLSFLGGGNVTGGFGLAEYNLFGFGKAAEIFYSQELYRHVTVIGYNDPHIFNTYWHGVTQLSEDSDGRIRNLLLEYPFFSVQAPYAASVTPSYVVDQERLFAQNEDKYRRIQTAVGASAEYALVATPGLVRRTGVRYQEWDDTFQQAGTNPSPQALGLENRRTHAFELTFTEWHPHFIKTYYLDQLGRPEDKDLGFAWGLRAGYSPTAAGASKNEFVVGTTAVTGFHPADDTYAWLYAQAAGRERAGGLEDAFLTGEGIVYQRLPKIMRRAQTFVADFRLDLSSGLYNDHEFVAGGDDGGLRGYPVNYVGGTRRMMLHLEDRLMVVKDLLHLVSLGGVAYFDGGEVWGRGRELSSGNVLASLGVGLRVAGTRGSLQIPVRLDFGVALVHHAGVNAVDVATGSGQAFGTFGLPFYAQDNAVTVAENLAPDQSPSPYPLASPFSYPGPVFTEY